MRKESLVCGGSGSMKLEVFVTPRNRLSTFLRESMAKRGWRNPDFVSACLSAAQSWTQVESQEVYSIVEVYKNPRFLA